MASEKKAPQREQTTIRLPAELLEQLRQEAQDIKTLCNELESLSNRVTSIEKAFAYLIETKDEQISELKEILCNLQRIVSQYTL